MLLPEPEPSERQTEAEGLKSPEGRPEGRPARRPAAGRRGPTVRKFGVTGVMTVGAVGARAVPPRDEAVVSSPRPDRRVQTVQSDDVGWRLPHTLGLSLSSKNLPAAVRSRVCCRLNDHFTSCRKTESGHKRLVYRYLYCIVRNCKVSSMTMPPLH